MRKWHGTGLLGAILFAGGAIWAQDAPAGPRRLSGPLLGQVIEKVQVVYPAEARTAHIQGSVVLQVNVGADGTVKGVEVISGPEALRKAASDNVAQWRYRPKLVDGVPTEFTETRTINFTLGDRTADPNPAVPVGDVPVPANLARVSGGVMAGQVLTKVNPTYPPDAKAKGISGFVVMAAVIGKDGTVLKLTVVSGPEDLRDSAVEAVRQWVYRPFLLNGQPTAVQTTVTVNFTLGG